MLRRRAVKLNALVLTFDDGPGSRLTPVVLGILAENNSKATFFLLGRNVLGREHVVRQIAEQGHEICSHGYEHLRYWRVSPIRAIRDIKRGWHAIDQALGTSKGVYPFRPPGGRLNLIALLYLWAQRVPTMYWTADIGDTWSLEKQKERIDREWNKIRRGSVVLAHDFDRATDRRDQYVLEAVRRCLTVARESKLKVGTFSELSGAGR